ncbi:copper homeostasis protein CutC [Candidatus Parcubacteria bacterium]|nr:copper homeostasis protein CutC [Candidatus Parcubacteria bacterium]
MKFRLEVIGFNLETCLIAQSAGAYRIELCDNPGDGGTTPSYGFIKTARKMLQIKLYPMIRPRGGDFLYSEAEFETMKTDIQVCKDLGCDGIVTGILNADGTVDKEKCRQLVELSYPLGVTFHRAFDRTNDPYKALEDIIAIGCERILTSGQKPTALAGAELIHGLIQQAAGRIIIMPGSGILSDNILAIAEKTGAQEFHSSAKIFSNSKMNFQNNGMQENLTSILADAVEVRKIIELLTQQQYI